MVEFDPNPAAHPYRCPCSECRALVAAITAQNKDDCYFFSDEELEELVNAPYRVEEKKS